MGRCGGRGFVFLLVWTTYCAIAELMLTLCSGADLVMSMGEPGLWSPTDLGVILGSYGAFIVERSGTDVDEALASLRQYENNIWVISQVIQNDIRYEVPVAPGSTDC